MKKISRFSLIALLLTGALLLSSCGSFDMKTADFSEYVSANENQYKNVSVTVDKTVLSDRDISDLILNARLAGKTAKEVETIEDTDIVAYHVFVFDDKGVCIYTDTSVTLPKGASTADTSDDTPKTLSAANNLMLSEQYEEGSLEKTLADAVLALSNRDFINYKADAVYADGAAISDLKGVLAVTYSANTDSPTGQVAGAKRYILPGAFTETGSSSLEEATVLGLKQILANRADKDNKTLSVGKEAYTIHVKPVALKESDTEAVNDVTSATVYYNYANKSGEFVSFDFFVTVQAMMYPAAAAEAEFLSVPYTFGAEATQKDPYGNVSKDKSGTAYFLPTALFELGNYADYIAAQKDFTPSSDDLAENDLIAEYEAFVKSQKQAEKDKAALNNAKNSIFTEVLAKATVSKYPEDVLNNYAENTLDNWKYYFFAGSTTDPNTGKTQRLAPKQGSFAGMDEEEFNKTYKNFDDFAVACCKELYASQNEGTTVSVSNVKEIKDFLKASYKTTLAQELKIRYFAQLFNLTVSDKDYQEKLEELASEYGVPASTLEQYYDKESLTLTFLSEKVADALLPFNQDKITNTEKDSKGNTLAK
ncbi:MAG: hypothetical protein MJ078_00145 [Clostridia bacterium]|nr:hypothetical protein [Clostridia bacterium]